MDGSNTIANVKANISAVAAQHDIPEASDDAMLLMGDDGKQTSTTEDDTTLSSLLAQAKKPQEGLYFYLVYSIGDNEYEPVEVEPTQTDS